MASESISSSDHTPEAKATDHTVKTELVQSGNASTKSNNESSENSEKKEKELFETIYVKGSSIPVRVRPHNWLGKKVFRRRIPPVPDERQLVPKKYWKVPSIITWEWLSSLIYTGYCRVLEINDVYLIENSEKNERRMADYHKKLSHYKEVEQKRGERVPFAEFRAILYALRWYFITALTTTALFILGEMGMSLMSSNLIQYVTAIYAGQKGLRANAIGFAIGTCIVQLSFQFLFVWNGYNTRALAEICRTMLISATYDKLTKLSPSGRQMYPAGKITSLITTDTNRIFMAARWTCMTVMFLPAFFGMLGILVHFLGPSGLPGCGLVLLGVVCNIGVSRILTHLRRRSLPFADKRIAAVRETVENMRVIKFYGWESSFVKLIAKARMMEINFLKRLGMLEGLVDASLSSIPSFGGALSFAVRVITGNGLDPSKAFPSLTLFQVFVPLSMMFSTGITSHADAWASIRRMDDFFRAPEEPSYVISDGVSPGVITIKDGHFKWDETSEKPTAKSVGKWKRKLLFYKHADKVESDPSDPVELTRIESARDRYEEEKKEKEKDHSDDYERAGAKKFPGLLDLNIDIKPKELIMVVGSIGTGKTTLLSAISGLVSKENGSVCVGGSTASVMSMWSQNSSIRDNILFGRPYDEKRYAKTVHACSLESDFDIIAGRDFAEVGERGITLSGGQKARVALARCVYAGGDVILLDDVLSAVDGKVANHIFQRCIRGMLRNSTRVMVTHNLKLLPEADRVIFLDGVGYAHMGTLDELLKSHGRFGKMYADAVNLKDPNEDPDLAHENEKRHEMEIMERKLDIEGYRDYEVAPTYEEVNNDATSDAVSDSGTIRSYELQRQLTSPDKNAVGASLTTAEQRSQGTVKLAVLYQYLSSGAIIGIWFIPVILIIQFGVATAQVMITIFMNFWTGHRYNLPQGGYIGFYCLIIACRVIFFVGMAVSVCFFCFNSSSKLHNRAVETIYKAPMNYFDSTPLGRIINRFTDDTANLDTQLFMQLRMTLFFSSMLLASLITVFVYIPYAILALVPIFLIGMVLFTYYRPAARELKRMNSIFRSSMFTLVTETISGLSVILSYKRQHVFAENLNKKIDDMNVSFQLNLASQYWLSLRAVFTAVPISLIVMILSICQVFDIDSSEIGMLMSLIPGVSLSLVGLLPMLAELENQMNSVERLHELAYELPQEAPFEIPDKAPPSNWPERGEIEFDKACLRYRENLPDVLHDFSIKVAGGEKIGICGRTGAGKSTILSALFRITELSAGSITIDGIDISTIGLRDLRTKLAIIPQEPVLFQGTIRTNLDPFGQYSDLELWDALRRSGVVRAEETDPVTKQVSTGHRFHLDTKTDSDGGNFSLGERQLLTLARALVRNAQIIVLDEATATVDFETDRLIQETIGKEFAHCTILCIAHRLQTIVNYDRVLIMDAGRAAEMDSPRALFDNPSSRFAAMCQESGITESDFL